MTPLERDPDGDIIPFGGKGPDGQAVPFQVGSMGELMVGLAGSSSAWEGTGEKSDTTDLVVAPARGGTARNFMTDFTVSNRSATAVFVVAKSGSRTLWRASVPPASTLVENMSRPLRSDPNATIVFAAETAVTSVVVSASGFWA